MTNLATTILIIDDEQPILDCFTCAFLPPQYRVVTSTSANAGVEAFLREKPDVVILDVRLPDMSGLEVVEKIRRADASVPVVLMTGHGTASTAIEAMRHGAFDYVLKPIDLDKLTPLVERAADSHRTARASVLLSSRGQRTNIDPNDSETLLGRCEAMHEVYRAIGRVASQDVTVLVLGESGSGKEVVARAICNHSKRANQKFLAINCAAIPETLLESELFGHERGAFTGADHKRIGKFELANEGTLFLDEIGDISPLMQTKLLRVLQDQTFERVGGTQTIRTHARLIAATNRDLADAIAKGEFRSDLFYRLNVYAIRVPPLRERLEDIPLMVDHFLLRFAVELERPIAGVSSETMELLTAYSWPGNVRELQSVIKHALLQATGPILLPAFLPLPIRDPSEPIGRPVLGKRVTHPSRPANLSELTRERLRAGSNDIFSEVISYGEREVISEVVRSTSGNLTEAAHRLGISRTTLRTKLAALDITVRQAIDVSQGPFRTE